MELDHGNRISLNELAEIPNAFELINQFFTYLSFLGNPQNAVSSSELQKYMTRECLIQSNQEAISHGIDEFIDYIYRMQKKYENVSYSQLLKQPIISENKAVVHFKVTCISKRGAIKQLEAIAILTIQNGKISHWTEVVQEMTKRISKKV